MALREVEVDRLAMVAGFGRGAATPQVAALQEALVASCSDGKEDLRSYW